MGALYANQSVSDKSWVNRCQATTKAISFWTQGSVADICGVLVTLVIRCVPDKVWTACTFLGVVPGLLLARQTHRDARESGWGPLHSAYIPNQGNSFHSQSLSLFWARPDHLYMGQEGGCNWQLDCKLQILDFQFSKFWISKSKPNFYMGREGGGNWRSSWQRKATEFTVDILADKHFLAATLRCEISILDQTPQRVDQV